MQNLIFLSPVLILFFRDERTVIFYDLDQVLNV